MAGALVGYVPWLRNPSPWMESVALRAYAMRNADLVADRTVALLFPNADVVRERAHFLQEHGYTLFHHSVAMGLPASSTGGAADCSIEAVNGRTGPVLDVNRRREHSGVRVSGWAKDAAGRTAARIFVSIDGQIDVPALLHQTRFDSDIRTSLFADGDRTLELKIVSHDGSSYTTCGTAHLRVSE